MALPSTSAHREVISCLLPPKTYGNRFFTIADPSLLISVPTFIRFWTDLPTFKSKLKTHLFKLAFNVWFYLFLCLFYYVPYPFIAFVDYYDIIIAFSVFRLGNYAVSLRTPLTYFIFTGLVMIGVIIGSKKVGINPDNVATPIAASLGDLITLSLLARISSTLYDHRGEDIHSNWNENHDNPKLFCWHKWLVSIF